LGSTITAAETICSDANNDILGGKKNTVNGLFGINNWMLGDKAGDESGGNDKVFFTNSSDLSDGDMSGIWEIGNPDGYTSIMFVLKAGSNFAAFLLDSAALMAGDWSTSRGLSHASVYYSGEPTPAPVPLPASALLLLGGVGGLAALRRRKKLG
jgi:hypothetical protein